MAAKHKAKRAKEQYKAQLAASQSERDRLRTAVLAAWALGALQSERDRAVLAERTLGALQSEREQLRAALQSERALGALQSERDKLRAEVAERTLRALQSERDQLRAALQAETTLRALQSERDQLRAALQAETTHGALQSERDQLRAALQTARTRRDPDRVSDYEWHVELAAKGLAQRDTHSMPKSVTTPEGFYEVMADAALDAAGLRALLERLARAERGLEIIQDALNRGPERPAPGDDRGER